MFETLITFIFGIVVGASLTRYFINPDIEYLKGFVDFHRKDLKRINRIKKRYLNKFDIKVNK